jgi:hypothetical protein
MSVLRHRVVPVFAASLAAVLVAAAGFAQAPQEVWTARDYCIRVTPGKAHELESFLRDVVVPLNQARADAGEFEWFLAERAVIPAGSSARCDYRVAHIYKGMPPEEATNEQLGAALKRAGMSLTAEQFLEKRSALTQLVSVDLWYTFESVGPTWAKGSYLKFNHYKVKDGQYDEYLRLERSYWKVLMEAWLKAGGKGSWVLTGLWMPGGDVIPYNAMTIDVFPDWSGLLNGVPVNELWPKAIPNTPFAEAMAQEDKVRSTHAQEVYRLVERVDRKPAR